jgi:hypothetical protein
MINAIEITFYNTKEDIPKDVIENLVVSDKKIYEENKEGDEPVCLLLTDEMENEETNEEINYVRIFTICSQKYIDLNTIFEASWKSRDLLKLIIETFEKIDIFEVSIDNLTNVDSKISLMSIKYILDSMLYDLVQK